MPTWFVIAATTLVAIHTALNLGCFYWLWREYHPRTSQHHAPRSQLDQPRTATPNQPLPTVQGWRSQRRR